MGLLNDASSLARQRLADEVKAGRRRSGYPKRAAFARQLNLNDSTLAIIENARPGPVADETVTFVTEQLGWPSDRWRQILADVNGGADELTDARRANGMTRQALARALEVGPAALAEWERGAPMPASVRERLRELLRAAPEQDLAEEMLRRARERGTG